MRRAIRQRGTQHQFGVELAQIGVAFRPVDIGKAKRQVAQRGADGDIGHREVCAGAGGAAHLPGMVASISPLPVIGVPIKSSNSIDGWDSILSILQMPGGVPVATVALNGAKNAGILAAQIIGIGNVRILEKVIGYKKGLEKEVGVKRGKLKG